MIENFLGLFNMLPFLLNFCHCIGKRKLGYLIVLSRPLTILRVEASVWFEPRKINLICTTGHRPYRARNGRRSVRHAGHKFRESCSWPSTHTTLTRMLGTWTMGSGHTGSRLGVV